MDNYLISKFTDKNGHKHYRITRTNGTKETIIKESESIFTLMEWTTSLKILKIPYEIEEIKRTKHE
jgi:hypothetical protein